jgi:hypothetical protein
MRAIYHGAGRVDHPWRKRKEAEPIRPRLFWSPVSRSGLAPYFPSGV